MTVAQLIKKLQRMPQDAIVTISNNDDFVNGEYKVTSIETYDCKTVEICTDYKQRMDKGAEGMNIAQELSIVRDNIAEYGMTNITQLEYDAIYQEGRAEGRTEGRADAINAIKNDLHKRLTEEMNNPYQDQGLCQGLYFGIQRCDWYLDDGKEQSND